MTTYTCGNFKSVRQGYEYESGGGYWIVDSASDAARIFANRLARRQFGRKGYCHHVRLDSRREDGQMGIFEVFIGYPAEGGGTQGHNEWLNVYIERGDDAR